ncbi:MAG TPA: phosphotransferase [Gemmatimonadaceae bacterium]|nr:phosphotransferase [Gemmatimonadaceae bacterium]
MSEALVVPLEQEAGPATAQLRAVLSRALERSDSRARIVDIERATCPNGSSWWLEEITLDLDDESRIALVFKNLVRETTGSAARRVKPAFVTDPTREPWVYENLLMGAIAGPPKLWAAVTDVAAARHWLFIERVNGAPLAQVGDRDAWCAAAEWLGRFHATTPVRRAARGPLLHHDREYHRRWLARALQAVQANARTSDAGRDMAREKLARLRALAPAHEHAIERALATGSSLIHGEFYASNVLVQRSAATVAVHPVDWEMAALGPPLLDLAALMSGRWSPDDRRAMATAYREGARSAGVCAPVLGDLLLEVTGCQLLLAIQWLGWAVEWTAPADHRNDWLEEAELCARELRG